jgi:N-acetylglutamate synthase-like GNAT family acetyltransferase
MKTPITEEWSMRLAQESDVPALEALISVSVRGLQAPHYSGEQMEAALGTVFGVDRQLIRDATYFVVEVGGSSSRETNPTRRRPPRRVNSVPPSIIGGGGWSKRKTLFGSDHHADRDSAELDPSCDAARIRAFFIHPDWARRGIATEILDRCEKDIVEARFRSIELASTLPGVPFYAKCGYVAGERSDVPLANGLTLGIVRMEKKL